MSTTKDDANQFSIHIAGWSFRVVAASPLLEFRIDGCLVQFLAAPHAPIELDLEAVVREAPFSPDRHLFGSPTTYAVGLEQDGSFLFRSWERKGTARVIRVDAGFRRGTIHIPPAMVGSPDAMYPLQQMDMILAVNRFARDGDLIVHSAAINDGGRGYLFVGPSHAGKSTMADLWATAGGGLVLGEDQAIVRRQHDGGFRIFGTPWHTRLDRCSPESAPLSAVFVLSHGEKNKVQACRGSQALTPMMVNSFLPVYHHDGMERILSSLDRLIRQVPIYRLAFRPDQSVIEVVQGVLSA